MRFFHLSDLHIGKQLHHYNMKVEQTDILQKIIDAAREEHPDAIVIAGDIYDKSVPSAEAVTLFDGFLTSLNEITPQIPLLLIAGNHDSAERLDYANEILAKHKVYISGMPPQTASERLKMVTLTDSYGEVNFYLMPFVKPYFVRNLFPDQKVETYDDAVRLVLEQEDVDSSKRNVLVSHQFYVKGNERPEASESETIFVGGIEEVDTKVLAPFDYAALGHIHRPQKIGEVYYRYCGTPLKYSAGEENQSKSITMVELKEKGTSPVITELPLVPLRDVRQIRGTLQEILESATNENKDDFVMITLTDDVDPYRPKERLEEIFTHILEIRVDNARTRKALIDDGEDLEDKDPLSIFQQFFEEMQGREMTEEEDAVIRSVFSEEMEKEDKL